VTLLLSVFLSVFVVLGVGYAVLLLSLTGILRRRTVARSHDGWNEESLPLPLVTVLVAARNEEHNLPHLLEALLCQDWPADRLQIVVVNDRSEDHTAQVLAEASARHPGRIETVHVTALPPGIGPKKHALLRGLEVARGTWICVTDADCTFGSGWLRALARHFVPGTGMVVGPSVFQEPENDSARVGGHGLLSGAAALEFASYSVASAAFIAARFPVIASANNLAYRRSAFEAIGGFARHTSVVNGDDDLLLQDLHHARNWELAFAAEPDAVVRTLPPEGPRAFWEQRKRWAGTCLHYRLAPKIILVAVFTFYAGILALLLVGATGLSTHARFIGGIGLIGFALKTATDFILLYAGLRLFGLTALLRHFPIAALFQLPLLFAAVVIGSMGRFTWKGQRMGRVAGR
jgi:cellulose synthase/poly-beta-1,6-N-acetylglucosamine synthase-like glycosyltransferase